MATAFPISPHEATLRPAWPACAIFQRPLSWGRLRSGHMANKVLLAALLAASVSPGDAFVPSSLLSLPHQRQHGITAGRFIAGSQRARRSHEAGRQAVRMVSASPLPHCGVGARTGGKGLDGLGVTDDRLLTCLVPAVAEVLLMVSPTFRSVAWTWGTNCWPGSNGGGAQRNKPLATG